MSTDFDAVLRRQRACRVFRDEPVPDELLRRVLELATFAPSAGNSQPWRFVAVRDAGAREAIGELARRAWESGGRAWSAAKLPGTLHDDVDRGALGGVAGAPVLIVVGVDTDAVVGPAGPASVWPAVQNLLLAATAAGLGSALTTLPTHYPEQLRALVGLPRAVDPVAVVPLGQPARDLGPPRRRPVDEVAWLDRYGDALG